MALSGRRRRGHGVRSESAVLRHGGTGDVVLLRPLPVAQRVGAEGPHSRSSTTLDADSFTLADPPLRIFDRVVYPVLAEGISDAII